MGGHFVKAYEISSPKSCFYIYDSSFLESSYRIYVNHSFLPTMKFLYDKRGDASSIIIQEKGDIIIFNDNYYQNPVYYNIRQQKITSSQQ